MKLVESYSLNSGLRILEPFLMEKFVPIGESEYILVHAGGGKETQFDSKLYNYYQEVISLLKPIIKDKYKLVQIGTDKDEQIQGIDIDLRAKTNIHQSNYLIKRCSLFLGNDSICAHLAGHHRVPMVSLYGGTSTPHMPYWFNKDKSIFLESNRNGKNPSYSFQENPKTINMIKPEQVVESVLKLLNLKWAESISTLSIGNLYKQHVIELIPNQIVKPDFFNGIANIRNDYYFNEQNTFQQLQYSKCAVVTPQPLDIQILIKLRPNIALVALLIDKFPHLIDYIKSLQKNLIQFSLITEIENDDELNNRKLSLMDYGIIIRQPKIKKESLEFLDKVDYNKTKVKSNHVLLSQGKIYAGRSYWLAGVECQLQNTESPALNNQNWIDETPNFWIYNK